MNEATQHTAADLVKSIAYCGLICRMCFLKESCDGCRSENNLCERNLADEGCYQKKCCSDKQYDGCWECENIYTCYEGIYSLGEISKIKAFALCIREDGKDKFIEYVMRNAEKGLSVEKGRDYDGKHVSEVLKMLRG